MPDLERQTLQTSLWGNNEDFTVIASHVLANCLTKLLLFLGWGWGCLGFGCFFFHGMEIEIEMLLWFLNAEVANRKIWPPVQSGTGSMDLFGSY